MIATGLAIRFEQAKFRRAPCSMLNHSHCRTLQALPTQHHYHHYLPWQPKHSLELLLLELWGRHSAPLASSQAVPRLRHLLRAAPPCALASRLLQAAARQPLRAGAQEQVPAEHLHKRHHRHLKSPENAAATLITHPCRHMLQHINLIETSYSILDFLHTQLHDAPLSSSA